MTTMDDAHDEGDLNASPRRAAWLGRHIGAETRRWLEEDERYFLRQALSTPCLNALAGCEGIWLEDLEGRRYMDFHGNSVHQVGFANPAVIEAIKTQLDALAFCTRRPAIALARKLAEVTPGDLGKSLFCPSGAAAVGMALRLARAATGRHKTVSMWGSFHGASLDTAGVGGERMFRGGAGPLLPGAEHVPPPDPSRCVFRCGGRCDLRCAPYVDNRVPGVSEHLPLGEGAVEFSTIIAGCLARTEAALVLEIYAPDRLVEATLRSRGYLGHLLAAVGPQVR